MKTENRTFYNFHMKCHFLLIFGSHILEDSSYNIWHSSIMVVPFLLLVIRRLVLFQAWRVDILTCLACSTAAMLPVIVKTSLPLKQVKIIII